MRHPVIIVTPEDIVRQVTQIRDIMQRIIDKGGENLDPYVQAKLVGGSIAGDLASLIITMVAYEYQIS